MLILGNPDTFSILIEIIDEWNEDDTFNNGLLFFSIGGLLFPNKVFSATLSYELSNLVEQLEGVTMNRELYSMPSKEAFVHFYNKTFPCDSEQENDYSFDITPSIFSDNNYFVFAVSNGEFVRVLASELQYNTNSLRHVLEEFSLNEVIIPQDELSKIILKLKSF